jgi:hypothetical protein
MPVVWENWHGALSSPPRCGHVACIFSLFAFCETQLQSSIREKKNTILVRCVRRFPRIPPSGSVPVVTQTSTPSLIVASPHDRTTSLARDRDTPHTRTYSRKAPCPLANPPTMNQLRLSSLWALAPLAGKQAVANMGRLLLLHWAAGRCSSAEFVQRCRRRSA